MRQNYASTDCAASIVQALGTVNSGNVLKSDRDSYLLYECSAPQKNLVIRLCEDILVDSVQLANFELFSSNFKDITIYGTDVYAHGDTNWVALGSFTIDNTRDRQIFSIDQSAKIWVSHLLIDFKSYWDNEVYCPLSILEVYGTTMLDRSKNMLTEQPDDREECDKPDDLEQSINHIDPCTSPARNSPLAPQQCCKPKSQELGGGNSIYEVILGRIAKLETETKRTEAEHQSIDSFLQYLNATLGPERLQIHQTLQNTIHEVQFQQKALLVQTFILMAIVAYLFGRSFANNPHFGYAPFRTLTNQDLKNYSMDIDSEDETFAQSPPLFSPAISRLPSPPNEVESE